MITNIGSIERIIRMVVGAVLLALMVVGPHTAWGLIGLVPLLTGAFGYCPLYQLVGFSTCPTPHERAGSHS